MLTKYYSGILEGRVNLRGPYGMVIWTGFFWLWIRSDEELL
jgi:hypothetical protein